MVALLGARPVGKTTLARQVLSAWRGPSVVFDLREDRSAYWNVDEWRRQSRSFTDLAVLDGVSATLTHAGETRRVRGARVSPNLFPLLGIEPRYGRSTGPVDEGPSNLLHGTPADRTEAGHVFRAMVKMVALIARVVLAPAATIGTMPPTKQTSAGDAGSTVIALPCPARRNDVPPIGIEAHGVICGSEGPRAPTEGGRRA